MSIRKLGGDWDTMLLGIEPRKCAVCEKGLFRNVTFLRGGWSRCTVCDEFVHYSCLASGKVKFLKQRPRICVACREGKTAAVSSHQAGSNDPTPSSVPTTSHSTGSSS